MEDECVGYPPGHQLPSPYLFIKDSSRGRSFYVAQQIDTHCTCVCMKLNDVRASTSFPMRADLLARSVD